MNVMLCNACMVLTGEVGFILTGGKVAEEA
jgi:hypothetical protein